MFFVCYETCSSGNFFHRLLFTCIPIQPVLCTKYALFLSNFIFQPPVTRLTNDEAVSNSALATTVATLSQTEEQKHDNEEPVKSGQNNSSNNTVTAAINREQNTLDKNSNQKDTDGELATIQSTNIETTRAEQSKTGSTSDLTLRLMSHASSKNTDMKLENCPQKFTILQCKQLLSHHYQIKNKQVWFCAGRLLKNDQTIKDARIPEDFMIQVHLK